MRAFLFLTAGKNSAKNTAAQMAREMGSSLTIDLPAMGADSRPMVASMTMPKIKNTAAAAKDAVARPS